jgi:hypothetical protein
VVISVEPASYHLALPKEGVLKLTLRIQERQGRARHTTLMTTVFTPRESASAQQVLDRLHEARFQGQRLSIDAGFVPLDVVSIRLEG